MAIGCVSSLPSIARLEPLRADCVSGTSSVGGSSFAGMLNDMLAGNAQANTNANTALADLATGKAQDLHTVSLAVAQADLSFRFILELRNRLTDAFQEVSRMQI